MASTLNYNTSPWSWSKCSRKYITEFLDTGYGECLLDEPVSRTYELPSQLPGQLYNANKQCELMFGPGSQVCPYLKQCKRLWCTSAEGVHKGCRTQHMPLADGTDCGHGMHCRHGLCVNKEVELRPVDGEWGPWGPYSTCSRSCGGGIRSAARDCSKPDERYLTLYLTGYNVVVRIPAGATSIDIRQHSYSGKPEDDNYLGYNVVVRIPAGATSIDIRQHSYSGKPEDDNYLGESRDRWQKILKVLCVGNLYNPDVRYSFNIPIEDRKEQFVWDSFGSWQECNSMCQGERKRKAVCVRKSDHLVVSEQRCEHLPQPALATEPCNTECEQRWHVVGKSECSAKCGPGYRTQDIQCMKYSASKGQSVPVESRFCSDQLKPQFREPCHGDCHLTSWHYSSWSQCSKTCGRGTRSRDSYCMNNLGRRLVDRECNEHQRVVTQTCNDTSCPEWATSEWTECLVTCGKGVRHRQVWCRLNEERLRDNLCNADSKPEAVGACELPECASWQVGVWGMCAVTCGHGYQMRAVRCVAGTHGEALDDRVCNAASRPRDNQECEMPACPESPKAFSTVFPRTQRGFVTQWRYGSWTPCSVTCGKGKRARYVSCRDAYGEVADESYCAHLPHPPEVSTCFSPCGQWRAGEWSTCSVTCGLGGSTRQVVCSNYHHQIDEGLCDPDDRPPSEQECIAAPCPSLYHLFPSNQPAHFPSVDYQRPHLDHPPQDSASHNNWNVPSADNQWRTGPWGACSSTCAGGFQRRVVVCQDGEGRTTNYCDERIKPAESRSCDSGPCPRWNYGSWGECTQTCGGGTRTRRVICQLSNDQRLNDHNCEILDKPPDREQCNMHPCPGSVSWHRGPWKLCSVSCGKGTKHRDVYCADKDQAQVEEEHCKQLSKPRNHKPCELSTSCSDVQTKQGLTKDGEYLLRIKGKIIQIYCAEMQSEYAKEYVTLRSGQTDNYSEVYGYRLQNPYECPFNGSRRQDCLCTNDYPAAGYTLFYRVRLDGQFSINLTGTGLRVSESTKWIVQGNYATVKVHRSQDGTRIYGRCGGYCGKCSPQTNSGLQVQVL
ncbi:UNVERIFIED_CONTAM: hypothetical protein FKN15_035149 [Acipenser sinensis]